FLQLRFVLFLGDLLRHVQAAQQPEIVHFRQRRRLHPAFLVVAFLQPLFHRLEQQLADGEAAIAGIRAFDHRPGRVGAAGLAQSVLRHLAECVIHLEAVPIELCHTPTGERVFSSSCIRFFCCCLLRWNQNFSNNTPSSQSIFSKRTISSRLPFRAASSDCPSTRLTIGAVYQEPNRMPILPLGGSSRQKRHIRGRSASSSEGSPKARVWMWRGSIHSLSRLTVSPLPAPSTPPIRISTGNFFACARSNCALSRASRNFGSCLA